MKKLAPVLLMVWIALGIFNFGAMNAECEWERVHRWSRLNMSRRDDLGIVIGESCLIPPIQVLTVAIITNFYQHGWYLGDYRD
jgi:hypothetical protein